MFKKTTAFAATLLVLSNAAFAMSDSDANGDKMITLEELQAAYPEVSEDMFNEADSDQDGVLTTVELADAIAAGVLPKPSE